MKITEEGEKKKLANTFWLDAWEGKCHAGYFYRSNIGKAIRDFEEKFKRKVVGITIDRESFNVDFILEEEDGQ